MNALTAIRSASYHSLLIAARDQATGAQRDLLDTLIHGQHLGLRLRIDPDEDFALPDALRAAADAIASDWDAAIEGED